MSSEDLSAHGAPPLPGWARAVNALSRAFGIFAVVLLVVSIGVICQMVFVRAVLGQSTIWQTEFSIFAVVAATFLGAPYVLLTRGHVAVDVLPLMVGHETRRWLFVAAYLALLAFCALFLWASLPWWYETWVRQQTTASLWRARLWVPYLSVPVGLALLCLQAASELVLVLTRRALPFNLRPDEGL